MRSEYFHRKATTSLEFAMVFPIFMLLVMGIFEFGKTVYMYHLNANAVREIAREASVNTGNSAYSIDQSNLGLLRDKYTILTGVSLKYHPKFNYPLLQVCRGIMNDIGFQLVDFNWKNASSDQYICAYGEIPVDLNLIFFKYTFYLKAQCCIKSEAL